MELLPLRLRPGDDLRRALEATALPAGASGAFVASGMGSLVGLKLRLAGASLTTSFDGDFELLTLAGSLTPGGSHLHVSAADAQGAVFGGHLVNGNIVRTTAEILLVPVFAWQMSREMDPATGFPELKLSRKDDEAPPISAA